jgi:serine protease Do
MRVIQGVMVFVFSLFCFCAHANVVANMPNLVSAIEKSKQAVVSISIEMDPSKTMRLPTNQFEEGSILDFFGETIPFEENPGMSDSVGSGFIQDPENGIVVTNYHVIEVAKTIIVRLHDRREYSAELIGFDKETDIAVLQIQADNLVGLKIGDSDDLKVGQWVIGIGSPFGFEQTVTSGIISATQRQLPNTHYVNFIQTDVAVNPGNSGGPLINLDGNVIGINSQIVTNTGASTGLSFSIPSNTLIFVLEQLLERGKVQRGWLGVGFQELDYNLARVYGLKAPKGALVVSVQKDSPAYKAGFEEEDVILSINSINIDRAAMLPPLIAQLNSGESVNALILRDNKRVNLHVNIVYKSELIAGLSSDQVKEFISPKREEKNIFGLTLEPSDDGLRIIAISDASILGTSLLVGDVITTVAGNTTSLISQLADSLRNSNKKMVAVAIVRGGANVFAGINNPFTSETIN